MNAAPVLFDINAPRSPYRGNPMKAFSSMRRDFLAVTAPRNVDGVFAPHGVKDLRPDWSRAAADMTLSSVDGKTM